MEAEIEAGVRRKRCHLMTPPHVIPGADLYRFCRSVVLRLMYLHVRDKKPLL